MVALKNITFAAAGALLLGGVPSTLAAPAVAGDSVSVTEMPTPTTFEKKVASSSSSPLTANSVNIPATTAPIAANAITPTGPVTITIVNQHSKAVRTQHFYNYDASAPVGGTPVPGNIPVSATRQYAVPTGWAGNVRIWESQYAFTDSTSQIEGSLMYQEDAGAVLLSLDVSFVTGFSVPITCRCHGVFASGCNKGLWGLHDCPNPSGQGSCINPHRNGPEWATDFFLPCAGKAYSFDGDHAALTNGLCGNHVTCCVGKSCNMS